MRVLLATFTLIGIVDQIDHGVAAIEWSDGTQSMLDVPNGHLPFAEGTTIEVVIHPPQPTSITGPHPCSPNTIRYTPPSPNRVNLPPTDTP